MLNPKDHKIETEVNANARFSHDDSGRHVKKVSNTETVIFVYDAAGKTVAEYENEVAAPQDAKVSYLTTDHLGSPRIKTDQNGQVISRTDLKPFGEEIYTGTGGRTTAQGYTGTDNVRQKFTSYERDTETDLDYAKARMHSYNFGRFTSPDPFLGSIDFAVPQTFNRYSYVTNNPLLFIDPTGLFIWSTALGGNRSDKQIGKEIEKLKQGEGNEAKIAELENILSVRLSIITAMNSAMTAADSGLLTESEQNKIKAAIKAYGDPGKDNGVTVGLSEDPDEGGSTRVEGKQVIVAFNPTNITAANVAHEGSHTREALAYVKTGTTPSLFSSEREAYTIGALTNVGLLTDAGGPRYAPTANNGVNTILWSVTFLTKDTTIEQAKAKISGNIDVHLANNQITVNSDRGKKSAFPGRSGEWR